MHLRVPSSPLRPSRARLPSARRPRAVRPEARAFTLPELLTVLAILAVLIGLLLPSIRRAREQANRAACMSNQHQLMLAFDQYVADSRGFAPFANWGWCDSPKLPGWLYTGPDKTRPEHVERGTFWRYLRARQLYRCPTDPGPWYPKTTHQLTSYMINGAIAAYGEDPRSIVFPASAFPNDLVVFWEVYEFEPFDGNDGSSYPSEGVSYRHGDGTCVAFIDGHTEYWTRRQFNDEARQSPGRLWFMPGGDNPLEVIEVNFRKRALERK